MLENKTGKITFGDHLARFEADLPAAGGEEHYRIEALLTDDHGLLSRLVLEKTDVSGDPDDKTTVSFTACGTASVNIPTASLKEGLIGSIKEGIFNSCRPENATYSVVFRREDYSQVEGFRALRDGASFEVHRDRKIYVSDGKVCYEITNKGSTQVNKKFNDAGVAVELGFANTHLKDLPDGAHPTESCTWVADEGVWRYELENEDGKLTAYFVYNAVADFITVQRYRLEYGTEGEPSYIYEVTLTDRGETEPMSVNDL